MIRSKEIQKMEEQLSVLEVITRAFSEIASTHMKETRGKVLTNRDFVDGLSKIFDDVRAAYGEELQKKGKGSGKVTLLSHNGKTVSVLLSANSGLYGRIVSETFESFKNEIVKSNTEITIVGKQGLQLFSNAFPQKAYTYFDVEDRVRDQAQLAALARHIVQYDEIHLFYGKFQNIVTQQPDMLQISSQIDVTPVTGKRNHYLFEPDMISLLRFFESELFGSLLTQTMEENTLAKFASRVLAMDAASERIGTERKRLAKVQLAESHREANKKQINALSGILTLS